MPPLSMRAIRHDPVHAAHAVERWGLCTLIVLGESSSSRRARPAPTGIPARPPPQRWDSPRSPASGGSISTASTTSVQGGTPPIVIYSLAHLPLLMGLAAFGAGIALVIGHAQEDRLGGGTAAVYLAAPAPFLLALIRCGA